MGLPSMLRHKGFDFQKGVLEGGCLMDSRKCPRIGTSKQVET